MIRYLSLFSGLEAAHLAWAPLGWECVGVAEIDPAPCAVMAARIGATRPRYMPSTEAEGLTEDERDKRRAALKSLSRIQWGDRIPNLGDVSQATAADIAALGRIDVVVGGSPCQDLSVAGKRKGLAGARSGLFFQQLEIFDAARHLCGARWLVWENVPGAFSSNGGHDFAVVVGEMAGLDLAVPADGWGTEGLALGERGLVEWSVLDAQWFGVAQRRRRVFAVLDTGAWADRRAVLLERDGLRGNSAPSREAGENPSGTLISRVGGGGGPGPDDAQRGMLIAGTLNANGKAAGSATQQDAESGLIIPAAYGGGANCQATNVATALHAHPGGSRLDFQTETFLVQESAPTLTGGGRREAGYSLDDSALIAFAQNQRDEVRMMPVAGALAAEPGMKQQTYIAFDCKASTPQFADDVSPTLRAMNHAGSHANAGGQVAITFKIGAGSKAGGIAASDAVSPTLGAAGSGNQGAPGVASGLGVRRLTPRECERLQGVPDDYTLVPFRSGKSMQDGPRYKMLGNSFAVPVVAWIGRQIAAAHHAEGGGR